VYIRHFLNHAIVFLVLFGAPLYAAPKAAA